MNRLALVLFTGIMLTACSTSKKVIQSEQSNQSKKVEEILPIVEEETTNTNEEEKIEMDEISSSTEETSEEVVSENPDTLNSASFDHSQFNTLLQEYVSDQGNVNYKGIRNDWQSLRDYIASLGNKMPNTDWSKDEKLAYWINAYNAMTIDLILRHYPVSSIKDIDNPWKQRFWKLGDKWYNLDEIEHQIIRKMGEPRIHFALVCAAVSCPKLYNNAFTAENLESSLNTLTREFLADTSKNKITEDRIEISKIFQWFTKDFKQNGSLIDFLNKYTEVKISDSAKKKYTAYNWDLND
ncbi:MAG: DUF547 domain-containing protein [bacterium]